MWVEDFKGKVLTNNFVINPVPKNSTSPPPEDQYLNYSYVSDFLVNSPLNLKIADPIIAPPLEWDTQQTN